MIPPPTKRPSKATPEIERVRAALKKAKSAKPTVESSIRFNDDLLKAIADCEVITGEDLAIRINARG